MEKENFNNNNHNNHDSSHMITSVHEFHFHQVENREEFMKDFDLSSFSSEEEEEEKEVYQRLEETPEISSSYEHLPVQDPEESEIPTDLLFIKPPTPQELSLRTQQAMQHFDSKYHHEVVLDCPPTQHIALEQESVIQIKKDMLELDLQMPSNHWASSVPDDQMLILLQNFLSQK